jgi:hypothetical protein
VVVVVDASVFDDVVVVDGTAVVVDCVGVVDGGVVVDGATGVVVNDAEVGDDAIISYRYIWINGKRDT